MLSDSRKKITDQNKTRLRHVIKFVEFCGRQERISKKQDGRLVGRTSSFRGEYSQSFIYKLRAFLDYSNPGARHFHLGGPLEGPVLQQGELSIVCVGLQCSGMTSRGKFWGGHWGGQAKFWGEVAPPGTPIAPPLF